MNGVDEPSGSNDSVKGNHGQPTIRELLCYDGGPVEVTREHISSVLGAANAIAEDEPRILSQAEFESFKSGNGFNDHFRGTYESEDGDRYLYEKGCHKTDTREKALAFLAASRNMISHGMLHPDTVCGIYETEDGMYQLYFMSPAIETKWDGKAGLFSASDDSPEEVFLDWLGRLEPGYDMQSPPNNTLIWTLNPGEARHHHNWGRDPTTQTMYPVDVEVISFEHELEQQAVVRWIESRTQ